MFPQQQPRPQETILEGAEDCCISHWLQQEEEVVCQMFLEDRSFTWKINSPWKQFLRIEHENTRTYCGIREKLWGQLLWWVVLWWTCKSVRMHIVYRLGRQFKAKAEPLIFATLKIKRLSLAVAGLGLLADSFFFSILVSSIETEKERAWSVFMRFNYEWLAGQRSTETRGEASMSGPAATPLAAQYQPKHPQTHWERRVAVRGYFVDCMF